jgi:hypothetical protein
MAYSNSGKQVIQTYYEYYKWYFRRKALHLPDLTIIATMIEINFNLHFHLQVID